MRSRFAKTIGISLGTALLFLIGVALDSSAAPRIPAGTVPQAQQPETSPGILRVTVTDPQQRALRGATCSLLRANAPGKVVATATTDDQGFTTFISILPGSYTLRVAGKGFETFTKDDVVVKDGAATDVSVGLAIASVAETVTIESPNETATTVAAGASIATGSLERQAMQRLPLATARIDEALPL